MFYNISMKKKKTTFHIFPAYCDKLLIIVSVILLIFSSFMIVSAEMGLAVGQTDYVTLVIIKQTIISLLSLIAFALCTKVSFFMKIRINIYKIVFGIVVFSLLITKAFGSSGGAYGWIKLGPFVTIQPSEIAKLFIILAAARIYCPDEKKNLLKNYKDFMKAVAIFFVIICFYQKDLGSAIVLLCISIVALILPQDEEVKKYQRIFFILIILGIFGVAFILSPLGTSIMKNFSSNYQIARFLASANPFEYQYDQGYHLIMGLVSFATGGLFGLGYGNSIHKYMNFPSPSTDFILPVIVEELGIIGFIFIIVLYGLLIFILIRYSLKTKKLSSKMIYIGVYTYIIIHFIFNVGGVSGLIPLTGVPLLVLSYGGTSTLTFFVAMGICESEIIRNRKEVIYENNIRQMEKK